jgi:hypothetical protein
MMGIIKKNPFKLDRWVHGVGKQCLGMATFIVIQRTKENQRAIYAFRGSAFNPCHGGNRQILTEKASKR